MDFSLLKEYSFWVVALGTSCLATATGIIGGINILKGQSLIGDAVGHAAFPGIVLSFMLIGYRNPLCLLLGAIGVGIIAFSIVQHIGNHSKVGADATMAIVLSCFFGLGMVLKSYIQGNPNFSKGSQAGLANYIFGQAAYMLRQDVQIIFVVSIVSLLFFILFYKEIKITIFDGVFARMNGIKRGFISFIIMVMTMLLIAAGLKAVGTILISSMLITPALTGLLWSRKYVHVVWISALTGGGAAFIGTMMSTLVKGMSTGPSIILVMSAIALLSVLIAPRGIIAIKIRRRRLAKHD